MLEGHDGCQAPHHRDGDDGITEAATHEGPTQLLNGEVGIEKKIKSSGIGNEGQQGDGKQTIGRPAHQGKPA